MNIGKLSISKMELEMVDSKNLCVSFHVSSIVARQVQATEIHITAVVPNQDSIGAIIRRALERAQECLEL